MAQASDLPLPGRLPAGLSAPRQGIRMPRRNYKQVLLAAAVLVVGIAALLYLPSFLASHRQQSANPRAVATSGREFPVTLTDVMGVETTITAPPKKIVSLSPNVTEILFAIGAGERVIADTTYCDYPPAAAKLPKIGEIGRAHV